MPKKRRAPQKNSVKPRQTVSSRRFAHPVLHLMNGERLYYVLLKIRSQIFDTGRHLNEALQAVKLEDGACGYFVFGTNDVILRVWSDEARLNEFLKKIEQMAEIMFDQIQIILTTRMLTWYQNKLEKTSGWEQALDQKNIGSLLTGNDVPKELAQEFGTAADEDAMTRFYIFFEQPYSAEKSLFPTLEKMMLNPEDEVFSKIYNASLYVYRTFTHKGVLLKGQMPSFSASSHLILKLNEGLKSKHFDARTVTYICSRPIKTEGNDVTSWVLPDSNLNPRYKSIAYNLVKSHDCNRELFAAVANADDRHTSFIAIVVHHFDKLWFWHDRWWDTLSTLRDLYRWSVFNKDAPLIGFLMRQYVIIESRLRKLLESSLMMTEFSKRQLQKKEEEHVKMAAKMQEITQLLPPDKHKWAIGLLEAIRRVGKEAAEPREITMGSMPGYLSGALKVEEASLSQEDHDSVKALSEAIKTCSGDRNKLMHGEVASLTHSKPHDPNYPWETYIEHYINLLFWLPRAMPVVERLWRSSNENEKQRGTRASPAR